LLIAESETPPGLEVVVRAIVIDDSRAMRGIIKRILKGMDFEISEACDGEQALKVLGEIGTPDVAMVDWNMPVMNGLQFITAVRKNSAFDAMRIVMVTTEVEMTQVESALIAGANEYVMKPFTEEIMREKLEMLGFGKAA